MTRDEVTARLEMMFQECSFPQKRCKGDCCACSKAIDALQAEPIERISDNTIVVKYADYEDIKRIILTNGDIFCKMFYEDNTQEDDGNYDSLIPDEYKTDRDLISRAEAIEAVRESCGGIAHSLTDILSNMTVYKKAKAKLQALPSADRPTVNAELRADWLKRQYETVLEENKRLKADRPSGEWEYDVDADDSFCTNCHKYAIRDMEMQLESDYCPNCGARMGVEE